MVRESLTAEPGPHSPLSQKQARAHRAKMALKQATDRATIAQLILGAGVASFAMALTFRKLRGGCQHRDKKGKASLRSEQLTKGSTPEHIVEHIARLEDPDYVCLSIAENKLTVRSSTRVMRSALAPTCAIFVLAGELRRLMYAHTYQKRVFVLLSSHYRVPRTIKLHKYVQMLCLCRGTVVVNILCTWYVCMVTHTARVWINRVRLPVLHVVS